MNSEHIENHSFSDNIKLGLSTLLLITGIFGFYYLAEEQVLWIRLLELLIIVGIAIFIGLKTAIGQRLKQFIMASRNEVRQVIWPSRPETMQTTLVIFIVVLVTALFLWAVDSILFLLVRYFTGQG